MGKKALDEIDDLFAELDMLLKNPDVGAELADAGVNVSFAMVAADGLKAYLHGDKARAADDLGTVAEEIAARLARSQEDGAANGASDNNDNNDNNDNKNNKNNKNNKRSVS